MGQLTFWSIHTSPCLFLFPFSLFPIQGVPKDTDYEKFKKMKEQWDRIGKEKTKLEKERGMLNKEKLRIEKEKKRKRNFF